MSGGFLIHGFTEIDCMQSFLFLRVGEKIGYQVLISFRNSKYITEYENEVQICPQLSLPLVYYRIKIIS